MKRHCLTAIAGLVLAAVTGYGQNEDRRHCREAGFDYHLTKPLAPEMLTSFVASPESSVPSLKG